MAYTNEALGKALEDLTLAYNNFIEKAKEAAIAAMGDTVIAQIKQEAKDHISAELATQKAALEQAIENAKRVINNSSAQALTTLQQAAATASGELTAAAEAKKLELSALIQTAEEALQEKVNEAKSYIDAQLQEAMATAESKLLAKVNSLFIKIFQNGYIQWPGMPAPDTLFTFEGYRWSEVNYDGCFFRAKGKGANPFNGEEQGDAIRNIKGKMGAAIRFREDGAFICENIDYMLGQGNYFGLGNYSFSADKVVPTAEENRPRNKTFIIWKLEKI